MKEQNSNKKTKKEVNSMDAGFTVGFNTY